MNTRRDVLRQAGAIAAGAFAADFPAMTARAQPVPPRHLSLGTMPLNHPILEAWREGVARLKEKPPTEAISWGNFAAIHGNADGFRLCAHGNWFFLPWHRAYLVMYERAVRELTGYKDFALPYWDWTTDRQLPAAFVQPTWNGKPNPLFEPQRTMRPTDSLGDEIVGQAVMNAILRETDFERFGTSRPSGQNSLDQSWIICEFCGVYGTLEQTPHNLVHNSVGGIMATAQSALDPIFMMHHCNIDRIWAVWNAAPVNARNSCDAFWGDMIFADNFYNPDGSPYSPKVSELHAPEALGYSYGLSQPAGACAAPAVAAADTRVSAMLAAPASATAPGISTFLTRNSDSASAAPNKPLAISVAVDSSLLREVARRKPATVLPERLNFSAARELAASGPRALALIRNTAVSDVRNTLYRIFIDCDYLSPATPVSDPHYAGTFGIFGQHEGHAHHAKPSVAVDLTQAIQRVHGTAVKLPGRVRVQLLPVPIWGYAGPAGTATPSAVEIAFLQGAP